MENSTAATIPEAKVSTAFANRVFHSGQDLKPTALDTLQINITKLCNQACVHCHVDSSPRRREAMSDETLDRILAILKADDQIKTLDITGGAPELHARFKDVVKEARALGKTVMIRHNLTVAQDPHPVTKESMHDLPDFFAEYGVEIVSSLPYYQEFFTDKQRGSGVFKKSITTLQQLNERGFGTSGGERVLNLVYNPVGAFLPPNQEDLEKTYKKHLKENFGISFDQLFALTNMPIHRFKVQLKRLGTYEEYMETLSGAFNPAAAKGIMCRNLVSVAYDGTLYDCDFNQVLGMKLRDVPDLQSWNREKLLKRTIKTDDHCFGCTAGAGSSCGGNTADE
ncbi:MAG: arsenosugar biosynthesis radical SAM protein ArsS [Pseudobacteriovorax sp.]|nr:arsenosugar biosynthesis radical SAM protein ArsS [Pseudobacteriovorax sp.]